MSKWNGQAVKRWRARVRKNLVAGFDSKCGICGYSKCIQALELHHVIPEEKSFTFGAAMASPKSWAKLIKEAEKCVLLCSNCHRELEYGVVQLPDNITRFDSRKSETVKRVSNYLSRVSTKQYRRCKYTKCAKRFWANPSSKQKYCGLKCSRLARRKVDRPDKETLREELQIFSMVSLGRQYGVSDNAVRKWAKQYDLL